MKFSVLEPSAAWLLDMVFPANIYCVCCGDTMQKNRVHGLCDSCAEKIEWLTEDPFRSALSGFAFDSVTACCRYGFYVRQIMNRLKLGGEAYIAEGLGKLMGERMLLEFSGESGNNARLPDIVTSVPMHREKLLKRGYNQAELLAKAAAKECGIPYAELLVKQKATASMRGSDAETRRSMLTDSFAPKDGAEDLIKGKHILLVDDVITTGSTADACARVLRSCGAARVSVLCFAVSGTPYEVAAEEADFEFPDFGFDGEDI